jgi:hypothetical protein
MTTIKFSLLLAFVLLLGAVNRASAGFNSTFETGNDGWTVINGTQINQWHRGTATKYAGNYSFYVSNDKGVSNSYTKTVDNRVHFYRPIGKKGGTLTFYVKVKGEGTFGASSGISDYCRVSVVEEGGLPQPGSSPPNPSPLSEAYVGLTSWTKKTFTVPTTTSNTQRYLLFTWRTNASGGNDPAGAIDNVSYDGESTPSYSLSVTGATITSKVYDGKTAATVTGVTFDPSTNLVLDTDYSVSAEFNNANAGTGKSVTVTVTLKGDAANNYTLANNGVFSATGNITPKSITVVSTGTSAASKVYDASTSATVSSVGFSGLVNTETLAKGTDYTVTSATFGDANVGADKPVTLSVALANTAKAKNYSLSNGSSFSQADLNASLTPKLITNASTGTSAASKVYDASTAATVSSVGFSGLVGTETLAKGTDYTVTSATFGDANVGAGKPVTLSVALANTAKAKNYSLSNGSGFTDASLKASITPKGITVADDAITATKEYDGVSGSFTPAQISIDGAALIGKIGSDDLTLDKSNATGGFSDASVQSGSLQFSGFSLDGAASGNYALAQPKASASITKAAPELKHLIFAPDSVVLYDGYQHGITVALRSPYTGMDNIEVKYGNRTDEPDSVGKYVVTVELRSNMNFLDDTLVLGTLTILPDTLSNTVSLRSFTLTDEDGNELEHLEVMDSIYYTYRLPCDNTTNNITIAYSTPPGVIADVIPLDTGAGITVGDNQIVVDVSSPGQKVVNIELKESGILDVRYVVKVEKPYHLFDLIREHLGNLRVVINNPEINGGLSFTSCRWYRKKMGDNFWGLPVSEQLYYSAGPNATDVFTPDDSIYIVLRADSVEIKTCPSAEGSNVAEVAGGWSKGKVDYSAYPNPVMAGGKLYLKSAVLFDETGGDRYTTFRLYNSQGQLNISGSASILAEGLTMPDMPGSYYLILDGKMGKREIHIAVVK